MFPKINNNDCETEEKWKNKLTLMQSSVLLRAILVQFITAQHFLPVDSLLTYGQISRFGLLIL